MKGAVIEKAAAATQSAAKILLIAILASNLSAGVYCAGVRVEEDEACNCDHCDTPKLDTVGEYAVPLLVSTLNKEDADGDGNSTICARDRDSSDKSFPTVCHMLCFNRCTRFDNRVIDEGSIKRYIATAYRTNYYKLHDGRCADDESNMSVL